MSTPQAEIHVSTGVDAGSTLTRSSPLAIICVASAFCVLFIRFLWLVNKYAVDIFFMDHWRLEDALLFEKHSWLEIFLWQHGPERQGIGNVLLKLFEPLIHWDQRIEAFGIAAVIALATVAALWLKYRLFGRFQYSDVAIPLLFFTPVQLEIVLGTNNPSHGPLPLLFLMFYGIAWTIPNTRQRHWAVLIINLLLLYTSFGLVIGPVTPVLFWIEYASARSKASLWSSVAAVASVGLLLIGFHVYPAVSCFTPEVHGIFNYFAFSAFMFSGVIHLSPTPGIMLPAMVAGAALLFTACGMTVVIGVRLLKRLPKPGEFTIVGLSSFSLLFCAATAYGRTCVSLAPASRYFTYMIPAFLGLYLAALYATGRFRKWQIALAVGLAVISSGWVGPEQAKMASSSAARNAWRDCYLKTRDVESCDTRAGLPIYESPEPSDLNSKLNYLETNRLSFFRSVKASK